MSRSTHRSRFRRPARWLAGMRLVAALAAMAGGGCASGVRTVPVGSHPVQGSELVAVESPPPPAKVERVGSDPGKPCMWLDGQWEWLGRHWEWTDGAWVVPPEGCYFAPPRAVWVTSVRGGQLFYMTGRWYRADGSVPCPAPIRCDAGH